MGTALKIKFKTHKEVVMKTIKRFLADSDGQDFAEYALILGAVAVVALAVISSYKNELTNAFNQAIAALQAASN
jgi:Flp pilus assembly pilin Flp